MRAKFLSDKTVGGYKFTAVLAFFCNFASKSIVVMIYPENFEKKIGFDEIRTQLRGRCISSFGTERVDEMAFMTQPADIAEALLQVAEFRRFMTEEEEVAGDENFFDVRPALMRIRPERTYMEEPDLYDLKRALETTLHLVRFFNTPADDGPMVPNPSINIRHCTVRRLTY